MPTYDRRTRLAPLPPDLDPMAIDLPSPGLTGGPGEPPGDGIEPRIVPLGPRVEPEGEALVPRSGLHLSIPHDVPDHDQDPPVPADPGDRVLEVVQQICATVVVVVAIVAGAALLLSGCAVAPEPSGYLAINGFAGFPTNTEQSDAVEAGSEAGPGFSIVAGAEPYRLLRLEAEAGWAKQNLHGCNPDRCAGWYSSDGDQQAWSLTLNGWLQTPRLWRLQPYAGGGAGPAYVVNDGRASDGTRVNGKGAELAWQLGAGLRLQLPGQAFLDFGWRRFAAGDLAQHRALVGLGWSFGS